MPEQAAILIVDDQPENLAVLSTLLQPHYQVRAARSGEQALRAVATPPLPDLVLLDVMMPGMDGYGVIAKLRANPSTAGIPVIFITALAAEDDEERGFQAGAVDYITKPIKPATVLARVRTHLDLKTIRDSLANQNVLLEAQVAARTQALQTALKQAEKAHAALKKSYFGMLMAINSLVDLRGKMIGNHLRRVAEASRQVALCMGASEEEAQDIFVAALLHDIGKIGFPDDLLHKPVSAMSDEQLALYRQHPTLGADALGKIESLAAIAAIVRHHHEHYDGSGFPEGRSGLEIPLGARIIAAVSDYDDLHNGAMTSHPMSYKQCHRYLIDERGRRYDPVVIDRLEPLLAFDASDEVDEIRIGAGHLREGMTLTRDVMHPNGFLLLSKNTLLARHLIDQLVVVERESGRKLEIFVQRERTRG